MLQELRIAARALARSKGLTAAAVICLALGIAANTTVFSATTAIVLHPVPTRDASNLVMVAEVPPARSSFDFSEMTPANYLDLVRMSRSFERTAAFAGAIVNITGIDEPERVYAYRVTPSYFPVLGAVPALGRPFTDAEAREGAPRVVIISDAFWHRRFGGDPSAVGRTVQLDGQASTIVGIMPADFVFPPAAELWTPLALDGAFGRDRDQRAVEVLARLRPGVSLTGARAEVRGIMRQLEQAYPAFNANWGMRVENADAFYGRHPRPFLLAELGAVAFVLLIACANVANLLLARATTRGREMAVRIALGASRWRLVRQLVLESGLLALAGGTGGVLLSLWGVVAVRSSFPAELAKFNPGWNQIGVNPAVLVFTAVVSVATALVIGIVPAIVAMHTDPQHALSESSRGTSAGAGRRRLRSVLVVGEMALAVVMLAGTLIMVRGFRAFIASDPGYRIDNALTLALTVPDTRMKSLADVGAFYARVADRVRQEPGVENAAVTNTVPPSWNNWRQRIYLEGEPRPRRGDVARRPQLVMASPGYFATMGIPLLGGRAFTENDDSTTTRVVVISNSMARRYWPGVNPIGKRIGFPGDDTSFVTVVGIVGDARQNPNLGSDDRGPVLYRPVKQVESPRTMILVVRTRTDPAAMTAQVTRAIAAVDPAIAPGDVLPLDRMRQSSVSPQRVTGSMMAIFAVIALLLAAVGIYGVMSYTVAQRTHDIGIRAALGAQHGDILRQVLGEAALLVGTGMAIGLVGAIGMARGLAHLLSELSPTDPVALASALGVLAAVAFVGSWIPARRATRIDPVTALRAEG